jgi:nucleotide-binding universal stress UspA family protein
MSAGSHPTLLCYDGSVSAKHALTVAAAALAGHPLLLLHIWRPPLAARTDAFSDPVEKSGPPVATLEHLALERATEIADEGQEQASSLGLDAVLRLEPERGDIGQAIVHVAEQVDASLIVIGTRGRTAVQQGLLGSVSGVVLARSTRPVLVIPAGA